MILTRIYLEVCVCCVWCGGWYYLKTGQGSDHIGESQEVLRGI